MFLELMTMAVVCFGGFVALTYYLGHPSRHPPHMLSAGPPSPIGALPENTQGAIIGHVRSLAEPLTAPLSGRPCVCYVAAVEQLGWPGLLRRPKRVIHSVPFVLEDDSGRAIIDPTGANLALFSHELSESSAFDPPSKEQKALLKRLRVRYTTIYGYRPMVFSESVIRIGDQIMVIGQGTREPDRERAGSMTDYRADPTATLLRLSSTRRHRLTIRTAIMTDVEVISGAEAPEA